MLQKIEAIYEYGFFKPVMTPKIQNGQLVTIYFELKESEKDEVIETEDDLMSFNKGMKEFESGDVVDFDSVKEFWLDGKDVDV